MPSPATSSRRGDPPAPPAYGSPFVYSTVYAAYGWSGRSAHGGEERPAAVQFGDHPSGLGSVVEYQLD